MSAPTEKAHHVAVGNTSADNVDAEYLEVHNQNTLGHAKDQEEHDNGAWQSLLN